MTSLKSVFQYIMAATVLFTVAACSDDDDNIILGGGGAVEELKPTENVVLRIEVPALKSGNQLISHWSTNSKGKVLDYCLEYDYTKYHSRWVAFRFDGITRQNKSNVYRKGIFLKDPNLSHHYIDDNLYFTPYQRGHLCASEDRKYSQEANDNTFYMSNMSPMIGDFNGGYWTQFESFVREKGKRDYCDTLYVVKGGTIEDGEYNGRVVNNRIVVPNYYFMALLKIKNNAYSSIGFWVEHKNYGYDFKHQAPRSVVKEHALSIDELEELTGIDFFHNLSDKIEEQVEKSYSLAAWGL